MIPRYLRPVLAACCLVSACAPVWAADAATATDTDDDTNFQYQTVTTKEGLTFRVPEDMPIENRGGIQAPIPFDEYMYGKFKQLDVRLKRMEDQLDRIETLLAESGSKKERVLASK